MMRNFSVGPFLICSGIFLSHLHFEISKGISFLCGWFYIAATLYKFSKGFSDKGGDYG